MEMGSIHLYSNKLEELSTFLSELFDLDLEPQGEDLVLSNNACSFKIHEAKSRKKRPNNDLMVDFLLDERDDLENLLQKIEFINYRNGSIGTGKLEGEGSESRLLVTDPDGRNWKFSLRN